MSSKDDRLVVRFDPETLRFWPETTQRRTNTNTLPMTITEYVENTGSRAPTKSKKPGAIGGKFVSRRFTVRDADGRKWYGQVKEGTDIVRLRPADEE